ncbi:MAG: RluA family pseudouridine synthase [Oscillospiraceae bacterium]|nr:RluA family pseudouridine synthase [Oscillospiraceae bacterium]MCR5305124.1 RluA family pseudouridine synthase [Oscillospiraceae bacterium]
MPILSFPVTRDTPVTLRQFLRHDAGVSAALLTRLKALPDGITVGGVPRRAVDPVQPGETVQLCWTEHCTVPPNPALSVPAAAGTEDYLVFDKPAGMPVHPSMRHHGDTLANCFAAQYPDCGFHAVNRLDRNTSGLCLIAKHIYAAARLSRQTEKRYYALLPRGLTGSGTVDAPIARETASVITRCVRADGQKAVTHYRVLAVYPACTLAELIPETGRTHQIRVHMAWLGYPLLGDALYGGDCSLLSAHALHCGFLRFPDPRTGAVTELHSPLRADMERLCRPDSPSEG